MLSTLTPSTYFLITFTIALFLHFIFPIYLSDLITVNLLQAIGIILLLIALTFNTLAFRAFKAHATPHDPFSQASSLITTGIFKLSRNPVYLALILVEFAFGFIVDSGWFIGTSIVLFILLNHFIIPNEEKMLEESFEKEYREYKGRVGRWVRLSS